MPPFFRKTVEIEDFALRVAILDECQIYLGGGGRFGRRRENWIEGLYQHNCTATRVQVAWQEFQAFYYSLETFSIRFFMGNRKLQFAVTRLKFHFAEISNFSKAFIV